MAVFATFAIGRALGSPARGLAAGILVGAYTEVFLESRVFMLDLPLTALVALTVWAVVRSEGFAHKGFSLAAGLIAGVGLLAKWTLPVFVGPVAAYLWRRDGRGAPTGARRRHLALALVAMAAVAAPWYLRHLTLPLSLFQSAYTYGVVEGDPGLDRLAGWTWYARALVYQLGPPFAALFLVGLAFARRTRGLGLCLVWLLLPLACFTLVRNKDYRFTMPVLPAVALLSVGWIDRLRPSRAAVAVGGIALAVVGHAAYLGWGWGADRPLVAWVRERAGAWGVELPSHPPAREAWPGAALLEAVVHDRAGGPRPARLSVLPDHPYLSRFTLRYQATRAGLPVRVVPAWSGPPLFVDYVLTKSGAQGPDQTTGEARALMARLTAGDPTLVPLLRPVTEMALPDGSRAALYRIASPRVRGVGADAVVARLRSLPPRALAWFARDVEGLRVEVEQISERETRGGHLARLAVRADSARLGDFRRKPTALRLRELEVALEDVRLNPEALVLRDALELFGAGRLVVRRAVLTEADLRDGLAAALPALRSPTVRVRGGRLTVTGRLYGIAVEAAVRPEPAGTAAPALAVWLERLRVGGLPLPAALGNLPLAAANPVVQVEDPPFAIEWPPLRLEDGRLELGPPADARAS